MDASSLFIARLFKIRPELVPKLVESYAEEFAKNEVSNAPEVDENLFPWNLNDKISRYDPFFDRMPKNTTKTLSGVPLHAGKNLVAVDAHVNKLNLNLVRFLGSRIMEHIPELNYHHSNSSKTQMAILWDMENCCIPKNVPPATVSRNIIEFLQHNTNIEWGIVSFSAYADFSKVALKVREGCQSTGVKLIDAPNVRKNAADNAILVDLFGYAHYNPPPSSIMLISGDVDFSNALHLLRRWGHTIILVIPSGVGVSPALTNSSNYVWEWCNVVRGQEPVHPSRSQINESSDAVNEEPIESGGVLMGSQPSSEYYPDDGMPVQHGELTTLKRQLVKLLEGSGGRLRLVCLASEYQKTFMKPLRVADYKALKLLDLLEKISDVISVEEEKVVILKK